MSAPFMNRKSFILLWVLLICLVFIVLVVPVINWTVNEFSWTSRSFMRFGALNLADAGAEAALWEILHNGAQFTTWQGVNPKTLTLASFKNNDNETAGDIVASALVTSPDNYLITSTGYVPSQAGQKVKKTVKVKVFPHALFNNGVFGKVSVNMTGNAKVDSYDSSIGPYSPLTARNNGDVGANEILSMSGNALIKGDVLLGPDGSASGVNSGNVTGEIFYSGNEVELAAPLLPSYLTGLPNLGNLSLSGNNTQTIPAGNYYYNSISLSGNSVLTVNSNVHLYVGTSLSTSGNARMLTGASDEIYIGGSASVSGNGIVNTTGLPGNLSIYGLGSATGLSFSGNGAFSGTIYAPDSSVTISGNGSCSGAVVGNAVILSGNGGFHYDETLSRSGPFSGYDIVYWQED